MNISDWLKKGFDNLTTICAKYINENNEIEYLPIFYIAGSQTLPPPLESKEEEELIKKLSEKDEETISESLNGNCNITSDPFILVAKKQER